MPLDDETKITIDVVEDTDGTDSNNEEVSSITATSDDKNSVSPSIDPSIDTPYDVPNSDTDIDKPSDKQNDIDIVDSSDDEDADKIIEHDNDEQTLIEQTDETDTADIDDDNVNAEDDAPVDNAEDITDKITFEDDDSENDDVTHDAEANDEHDEKNDSATPNVSIIDANDKPIVSLKDDVHAKCENDIKIQSRKKGMPKAVKVALSACGLIAIVAALITATLAYAVIEIHPSVHGGETIASKRENGIDGSGTKVDVSYTVKDAMQASKTDTAQILAWTDNWYSVAHGADGKDAATALAAAGKGSKITLSDGTIIKIDGRYPCKSNGTDAGIDADAIDALYKGKHDWVAIRYDSSNVLVGKLVDDVAKSDENVNTNENAVDSDTNNTMNADSDSAMTDDTTDNTSADSSTDNTDETQTQNDDTANETSYNDNGYYYWY